ncbi:hypothetical protein HPG69_000493 [Diceros bicornis minor]|uniref:Ras-associating domain-containing protein n=1 Tax=Diceros bicornis minor TaxID=77932 RepID=A0A7J7EF13_DICBM|nr:hypothetical protein HPG69_000493 [Diceros bicornis minor]
MWAETGAAPWTESASASAPVPILRKLSREKCSSPGESPGDPSSPASSRHPHCLQLPLSLDPPGPRPLALPLSGPRVPPPGQQGSEARVIRVSIDNDHGNVYRSILLTSQDKAPSVVQRALQKHNVAQPWARDYQLFQVLPGDRVRGCAGLSSSSPPLARAPDSRERQCLLCHESSRPRRLRAAAQGGGPAHTLSLPDLRWPAPPSGMQTPLAAWGLAPESFRSPVEPIVLHTR